MTPDEQRLAGLSASDTRWLVEEAQRVLADLGKTSTVLDGVALRTDDGQIVGLDNLARTISSMPRGRRAPQVREQLTVLCAARPDQPPDVEDLRVKLWPQERADQMLRYEALRPLPGLVAVLAAKGAGFSLEFGDLDLVGDRDQAYDAALRNMIDLPRPRHTRRRVDPRARNTWVEFLDAPDAYGAARIVVLPDLLRKLRIDFPTHGVLVCVPTKFELWVHVPIDEDAVAAAVGMAQVALRTFAEDPYPISPDVFLVTPDMVATCLIRPDGRGLEVNREALTTLFELLLPGDLGEAS